MLNKLPWPLSTHLQPPNMETDHSLPAFCPRAAQKGPIFQALPLSHPEIPSCPQPFCLSMSLLPCLYTLGSMAHSLCGLTLWLLSCTPQKTHILPALLWPCAQAHEDLRLAPSVILYKSLSLLPSNPSTSSPLHLALPCPLPLPEESWCRRESPANRHLSPVFVKKGFHLKHLSASARIPQPLFRVASGLASKSSPIIISPHLFTDVLENFADLGFLLHPLLESQPSGFSPQGATGTALGKVTGKITVKTSETVSHFALSLPRMCVCECVTDHPACTSLPLPNLPLELLLKGILPRSLL